MTICHTRRGYEVLIRDVGDVHKAVERIFTVSAAARYGFIDILEVVGANHVRFGSKILSEISETNSTLLLCFDWDVSRQQACV
jgi:hypothetical protein